MVREPRRLLPLAPLRGENMAGSAPVAVSPPASAVGKNANYLAPLSVLTSLFFMWGFLTSLNDVLSPHLQALFDLNYFQAGLIQTAFFLAYFVVSTPSGRVVEKFGYKNGIIIGLIVAGIGCLIFYPAAGLRSFNVFLVALFVLASGITLLQVAANPFVAVLGKPETASARLTLTQAFNSLATYLGPKFGAAFILATVVKSATEIKQMTPQAAEAYRVTEASSVQNPYLGLAATLGVLAVAIAMSKLPRIQGANVEGAAAQETDDATHASAWSYRHLVLGAAAIFLYVGGEVTIGNFLVRYFKQPELGGLPETVGANYLANYWGCAMVGRFLGSLLTLRLFKPRKVLAAHAFLVVAL